MNRVQIGNRAHGARNPSPVSASAAVSAAQSALQICLCWMTTLRSGWFGSWRAACSGIGTAARRTRRYSRNGYRFSEVDLSKLVSGLSLGALRARMTTCG